MTYLILLFIFCLSLSLFFKYKESLTTLTQMNLPVTFNSDTVDYGLQSFGGAVSSIVVDPTLSTNKVAKVVKYGESWTGTTITSSNSSISGFSSPIPFTKTNRKINIRIWSPKAGIPIRLKIENSNVSVENSNVSVETETLTVGTGWRTLEFDFDKPVAGTPSFNESISYNLVTIFFNFGVKESGVNYYFDDVKFGPIDTTDTSPAPTTPAPTTPAATTPAWTTAAATTPAQTTAAATTPAWTTAAGTTNPNPYGYSFIIPPSLPEYTKFIDGQAFTINYNLNPDEIPLILYRFIINYIYRRARTEMINQNNDINIRAKHAQAIIDSEILVNSIINNLGFVNRSEVYLDYSLEYLDKSNPNDAKKLLKSIPTTSPGWTTAAATTPSPTTPASTTPAWTTAAGTTNPNPYGYTFIIPPGLPEYTKFVDGKVFKVNYNLTKDDVCIELYWFSYSYIYNKARIEMNNQNNNINIRAKHAQAIIDSEILLNSIQNTFGSTYSNSTTLANASMYITASNPIDAKNLLASIPTTAPAWTTAAATTPARTTAAATTPIKQMNLPISFNSTTVEYAFNSVGGAQTSIANDPEVPNKKVAKVIRYNTTWAASDIAKKVNDKLEGYSIPIPFTKTNKKMNVRVWTPKPNIIIRLKVSVEPGNNYFAEKDTLANVAGWQTLEWDFEKPDKGTLNDLALYNCVTIFFNYGKVDSGVTYYFDDIQFGPIESPIGTTPAWTTAAATTPAGTTASATTPAWTTAAATTPAGTTASATTPARTTNPNPYGYKFIIPPSLPEYTKFIDGQVFKINYNITKTNLSYELYRFINSYIYGRARIEMINLNNDINIRAKHAQAIIDTEILVNSIKNVYTYADTYLQYSSTNLNASNPIEAKRLLASIPTTSPVWTTAAATTPAWTTASATTPAWTTAAATTPAGTTAAATTPAWTTAAATTPAGTTAAATTPAGTTAAATNPNPYGYKFIIPPSLPEYTKFVDGQDFEVNYNLTKDDVCAYFYNFIQKYIYVIASKQVINLNNDINIRVKHAQAIIDSEFLLNSIKNTFGSSYSDNVYLNYSSRAFTLTTKNNAKNLLDSISTTPARTTAAATTPAWTTAAATTPAGTTAAATTSAWTTAAETTPAWTTAAETTPAWTTAAETTPAWTTAAETTPAWTTTPAQTNPIESNYSTTSPIKTTQTIQRRVTPSPTITPELYLGKFVMKLLSSFITYWNKKHSIKQ
jgi:hypothetical protein